MVEVNILKTHSCVYCPKATEIVRRIALSLPDVVITETFLDTDPDGQEIAERYNIMSVPAILINGNVAFVGVPNENALRRAIEEEL